MAGLDATTPPRPPMAPPPEDFGRPAQRPLRFSVRSLLTAMTLLAVLLALLPHSGIPLAGLVLSVTLLSVIPVCLASLAIYCRGYRQTFFLGVLAGALGPYFFAARAMRGGDLVEWMSWLVLQVLAAAACGFTALATRRFVERRGWHEPVHRSDSPRG